MTETYSPSDPLPALTSEASDALCAEYLRRDAGMLARVQQAAGRAYDAARTLPVPRMADAVTQFWIKLAAPVRAAHGTPAALRLSWAAGEAMRGIVELSPAHRTAFANASDPCAFPPGISGPLRREAMLSQPALAAVLAAEDAESARITALQQQQQERHAAAYEAARPGVLLKALRERGIGVELDRGRLTVSATAALSDAERAEAAAMKAGLVDILTSEAAAAAEAARRVVLA